MTNSAHTFRLTSLRLALLVLLLCASTVALSGRVAFANSKELGAHSTNAYFLLNGSGGSDDHGSPTPTPTPGAETRVEIDLVGATLNGATPRGEAELKRRADGR